MVILDWEAQTQDEEFLSVNTVKFLGKLPGKAVDLPSLDSLRKHLCLLGINKGSLAIGSEADEIIASSA